MTTLDAPGYAPRRRGLLPSSAPSWWAPALAAGAALAVWRLGLRGADVPAQTYYVHIFRSYGLVLWDNGWYSGHFQLSYSVLFPALGAVVGLYGAAMLCAAAAAWAFARLVATDRGERHLAPVLLFATGTVVAVAIGQLPFLAGLAAALLALLAARRGHGMLALPLAVACTLYNDVAAVLLLLAVAAWALTTTWERRRHLVPIAVGVLVPFAAQALLLPRLGPFSFAGVDLLALEAVCVVGVVFLPKRCRTLRVGLVLYGASALAVFVVPNPLGGNIARGVLYFAPALVAYLATLPGRRLLALLVLPLLAWQYVPASSALTSDPSAQRAYFTPLVDFVRARPSLARVEIPFTSAHWEAAYVAPQVPLARGWLRQVDTEDNPIFYTSGALTSASYHRWLDANGVTLVALPDVSLDYSSIQEARLLGHGQPYLRPVWHNQHWRVWRVLDSPGLVSGPAHAIALTPDHVALDATGVGTALVRVHDTAHWSVSIGQACVLDRGGWTEVVIRHPGPIDLTASLLSSDGSCASTTRVGP